MTPEQLREWADLLRSGVAKFPAIAENVRYEKQLREHADALEELAKLRARLEIDFATDGNGKRVPFPTGGPDGIACRDETIRILESALAEAERKCARLRFHAKAMATKYEAIRSSSVSMIDHAEAELYEAVEAYRAEFREES